MSQPPLSKVCIHEHSHGQSGQCPQTCLSTNMFVICLQQQPPRQGLKASAGLCCSISPQKLNKGSPNKQGSVHVPVWAAFGGPPPSSGDPAPLLGHTADSQTDTTPQLLTSPRMSGSNGNLDPARPHLDVEFLNMGMRLKGTGMKVLAGVTGRLRASHLTAIMGPSGAGQLSYTLSAVTSIAN